MHRKINSRSIESSINGRSSKTGKEKNHQITSADQMTFFEMVWNS